MVVNACSVAKSIEQENNITSYYSQYDSDDCYDITTVQENAYQFKIVNQLLTTYFDPEDYAEDGTHHNS